MGAQGFVLGACDMGLALLVVLLSVPLVRGNISRNAFYGVRTKVTLASDENWYRANAYGGKQLLIWAVPMFLAGAVAFFLPVGRLPILLLITLGALAFPLFAALATLRYVRNNLRLPGGSGRSNV